MNKVVYRTFAKKTDRVVNRLSIILLRLTVL